MAENTSATGGYLIPEGYLKTTVSVVGYTKDETDALLEKKENKGVAYTKAETDALLANVKPSVDLSDVYSKSETNALLSTKVDTATLEANYTKNTDLNKALNDKVSSADLAAAVKTRQDEQAALQKSVLETAADLQGQITTMQGKLTDSSNTMQSALTTMQGKLTDASTSMEQSLTAMQSSLTSTADSINARYDELVANVTKVSGELSAKDAALQSEIDALEALIPTAAAADNQLADKAYVEDLVKKGAARAISADAAGAGFASLDALTAGPWYSLGVATTPAVNDYAVVKADATHSGNDVRYNYDGAVWVFFQEFSSGGGSLDLTTAQNNALNSGITAALVAKISANENAAATESAARSAADTELLAKISTEASARETADNNLTAGIAAEKLARENADNQLTAKIETESANRGTAINEVKAQISTAQSAIETQIGSLAALNTHTKTSIVEAVNDLHTETHNERLAVDGSNQMTAQLDIVLQGSGDLLLMKAGDKGVNFYLDASTGYMSIIPESARTTGFEVSYNTLKPRTSAVEYSLGDTALPFTNLYTKNINGTAAADFATATTVDTKIAAATADMQSKTEAELRMQNLEDRVYILENKPAASAIYFLLPTQQLILSSSTDKYAENFETNIDAADLSFTYATSGLSTLTLESSTKLKFHYMAGTPQNFKFTVTYVPTGEEIGYGYLCTSSNGGYQTKIIWVGVSA